MSAPIDKFHAALRAHGYTPKTSSGGWTCVCPAHDDRKPSLSIRVGVGGRVLLKCHAGCVAKQVAEAIGLSLKDLMPEKAGGTGRATKRTKSVSPHQAVFKNTESKAVYASLDDAVAAIQQHEWRHIRTWKYLDRAGEAVGAVARWQSAQGKQVRPFVREGDTWCCTAMPSPRPLLNLAELTKLPQGARVYVVEGEITADAARSLGMVATTSAGGSQAAAKSDWSPLEAKEVVVLPDNDAAGEKYGTEVAQFCLRAGADSVRILRLAETWDLPKGGDLVDVIEQHGEDCERLRHRIEELADAVETESADGTNQAAAFRAFPTNVLPEILCEYIRQCAAASGYDESFLALPLLSALASAIGNSWCIRLNSSWIEYSILWTAIVGESGTLKSPAIKDALNPLYEIQDMYVMRHTEEMKEYEHEMQAFQDSRKSNGRSRKAIDDLPEKPEMPECTRCVVSDTTIEALCAVLRVNPRGVILVRDELSGWFAFGQYKKGNGTDEVARWLQMYQAGPLFNDRKSGGFTYISSASVCITGGIQPGILRRVIGQEHKENGLLARLLLTFPPRRAKRWSDAEVCTSYREAIRMLFNKLIKLEMVLNDNQKLCQQELPLTERAKLLFVDYVNTHGYEQLNYCDEKAAAYSKLEGVAARLALVIYIVKVVSSGQGMKIEAVDAESMAAGIQLAKWFRDETLRIYDILRESDEEADLRTMQEQIERRGGTVTFRDWQRLRSHSTSAEARDELSVLVDSGVAEWYKIPPGPKGGRPSDGVRLTGFQPHSDTTS